MIPMVHIDITLFDSGCLPSLLGKELAAVLRQQRTQEMSAEQAKEVEAYRVQLANCLAAVAVARQQAVQGILPRADAY